MSTITKIYSNLKGDKVIWLIVTLLGLCSLLAIYSSVSSEAFKSRSGNINYYLFRHFFFLCLGAAAMFGAYKLHYMRYSNFAPVLFIITIFLLIFTLGFGTDINDAKRWITIPFIDKTFQTSDLAKIALIIYVARALAIKQEYIKDFKSAFVPIILPVILVCGLIAPADLSTAALLFGTCILMMIIGRVSLIYVGLLVLMGALLMGFLILIGTYFPDVVRLETWVNRFSEYMTNADGGYQIQQSKIAIANGEWFGSGPGNSFQKNYLPYPYADFVYAVICEEYGILGGFSIVGLYLWLLFRCTSIVTKCPKTFGSILAMGLCLNIVVQAFANIAVSVHLVPVTGLTLPIISMGGTSVVFTCISFGIILSVSKYVDDVKLQEKILKMEAANANNN